MEFVDLIGLELCQAKSKLEKDGVDFDVVFSNSDKQVFFDKVLVVAVQKLTKLTLICSNFLFVPNQKSEI